MPGGAQKEAECTCEVEGTLLLLLYDLCANTAQESVVVLLCSPSASRYVSLRCMAAVLDVVV